MTPEQVLDAVDTEMSGRFRWGVRDCCTAAGKAFRRLHGFDPMAGVTYADKAEARALVEARGGPLGMMRSVLLPQGFREGVMRPGSVGLVLTGCAAGFSAAVCIRPGDWAVKAPRGWGIVHEVAEAWSCES